MTLWHAVIIGLAFGAIFSIYLLVWEGAFNRGYPWKKNRQPLLWLLGFNSAIGTIVSVGFWLMGWWPK